MSRQGKARQGAPSDGAHYIDFCYRCTQSLRSRELSRIQLDPLAAIVKDASYCQLSFLLQGLGCLRLQVDPDPEIDAASIKP